ncbi:MAG: alpha-galactosidase [Microbacterium sp.]
MLDVSEHSLPAVLHWGAPLTLEHPSDEDILLSTARPAVNRSSYDEPRRVSLLPLAEEGWAGTSGLSVTSAGRWLSGFRTVSTELGPRSARFVVHDEDDEVELVIECHLSPRGLLTVSTTTANLSDQEILISDLRALLPIPDRAAEVLSLTGRWSLERQPQRQPLAFGTLLRGAHRGRPGHDSPLVLAAGTAGFGWRGGEVWGVHVAWSGDTDYLAERLPEGAGAHSALIGGGRTLGSEPLTLPPGGRAVAPDIHFAYSSAGLDGISASFHEAARIARPTTLRPRPVILNTWEATYFDLDAVSLRALADEAAGLGVERFVVDDGWFRHRRNSDAGLGDWYVDESVWHGAFAALADHIRSTGMEFGLWFEPEMVNPDSDLARAHPEWILGGNRTWRNQQALDLSSPLVRDHLVERVCSVVEELGIAYIKWDHNRDVSHPRDAEGRRKGGTQTEGLYEVLSRIRTRHPSLEIESCASGGGRVDFGMLPFVERFWPSDTNDPVERQTIQQWTQLLMPPEMLGTHLGPATAHTTDRATSLDFRLITAFFGHAGIEWDVRGLDEDSRRRISDWITEHKRLRPLLHGGTVVNADVADGQILHGVVADDASAAVFAWIRQTSAVGSATERVRFPGLDRRRRYRLRRLLRTGPIAGPVITQPPWSAPLEAGSTVDVSGEILSSAGVPLPMLHPASGILLELNALPD